MHQLPHALAGCHCRHGFRRDGYNALGYDKNNQHKDYKDGYDRYGFDRQGWVTGKRLLLLLLHSMPFTARPLGLIPLSSELSALILETGSE